MDACKLGRVGRIKSSKVSDLHARLFFLCCFLLPSDNTTTKRFVIRCHFLCDHLNRRSFSFRLLSVLRTNKKKMNTISITIRKILKRNSKGS